jgi:hypothetical protein
MPTDDNTVDTVEAPGVPDRGPAETPDAPRISRRRLIWVDVLIGFTTVLSVVGLFAIWANRQLFNPDNWSKTSTQLLANATIRSAIANYAVDQLYANVDVAGYIKQGLPPRFQQLAGPAAGALRNAAVQGTELALSRPVVQNAWEQANRAADQTFVNIVEGGKGVVATNNGVVTLKLGAIVDNIANRLGLPSNLSSKLPPSAANLKIIKSNQLKFVQNVGNAIKGLALWLNILVPLLWLLAIFLARAHRRRTLMSVGFSILGVGVLVLLGRRILETQITNGVTTDASLRPAINAAVAIGTGMLKEIAGAFVIVGAVVVVAAWFAGPAKIATAGRRAVAPFLREQEAWTFGIVAGVMVLIFIWQPIPATGTPIGILVFLALALFGTEMLRRQTAKEFPDARPGDATAAIRARMAAFRERRHSRAAPQPPAATSLPEQLERLAGLRDNGSLTPEEYEAAKARLLGPAT